MLSIPSTRSISTSCRLQVTFVYKVTLKTGDKMGAGTDSNIYLRMIGDQGSTDEIRLNTAKTELERGSIDHYNIASEDVGPLKKIIVRHDNTGFAPGWYLDWISIRDGKGKKYNFKCDNWLVKGEAYGNIKLLKEDRYVTGMTSEEPQSAVVPDEDGTIQDMVRSTDKLDNEIIEDLKSLEKLDSGSNSLDDEILRDLKGLERFSGSPSEGTGIDISNDHLKSNTISGKILEDLKSLEVLSEPSLDQENPRSMKHATSLSPAVRNLLDTFDIDMTKVPSSGPYSRILKGDVLAYIAKENITRKKFVVNMTHPIVTKVKPLSEKVQHESVVSVLKMADNYLDHINNENKQLLARELTMNKLEIPHLYMSITCSTDNLDSFSSSLECNYLDLARNIVLVRILCRSLKDTYDTSNDSMDILVTHNGSSVLLKKCSDANVENIYQQYRNFEDNAHADGLIMPNFGLNIIDTDGVSQLSSILRVGQIISLNISGTKLGIDDSGKITRSITAAISCDSRVISEAMCASLLVNCKKYFTNPSLLGL